MWMHWRMGVRLDTPLNACMNSVTYIFNIIIFEI